MYLCNNGRSMTAMRCTACCSRAIRPGEIPRWQHQRVDLATGQITDLYRECNGRPCAPNDLVMDGEGGFWFTDNGITDVLGARTRDLTAITTLGVTAR